MILLYYPFYYDATYLLVIVAFVITTIAQLKVSSNYNKYKQIACAKGVTGREVARDILDKNGLEGIQIREVNGNLSDHYDPTKKTVNLSPDIYNGNSIAAIAVAAHECGHAIQDKEGYLFLRIRHSIIPGVNLCSKLGYFVIILGFLFSYFELAMIGFIMLCGILVFQLVTLPVEFNASNRAMVQLKELNIIGDRDNDNVGVKAMLGAAAMTYVASLASTLLQLLRMLLIIMSRRNDD